MAREPIQVPFGKDGALMHYARPGYGPEVYFGAQEWRPATPIALRLTLSHTERGRSAAYFVWTDEQGRRWPMFMTDIADLLQEGTVVKGVCEALWMPRKRGQNFGLSYAGPIPQEAADGR